MLEQDVNRLTTPHRARILTALLEGMGINGACRVADASKNTVLKLLANVGQACALYQDQAMRNLTIKQVQVDEICSFIGATQKDVPIGANPTLRLGDCYTYTAIDPVTKLMPCWLVGYRTDKSADHFMADLAPRLANRVQLTANGMGDYPRAIAKHFSSNADFAILNKSYEGGLAPVDAKRRYEPAMSISSTKDVVSGSPELTDIATSHVDRANLSMRMGMRRFPCMTNASSKRIENHMHAISFYFMVYNFAKKNGTMETTPAIAADVTTTEWTLEDIVTMADTVTFAESS